MKTYLLDIPNRYNRFSKNLDVKTILCNKSWLIFNDSGDKELYIFQENGSLITSINGSVINATWQYLSANNSLVISFKEKSYMLHPSFKDDVIQIILVIVFRRIEILQRLYFYCQRTGVNCCQTVHSFLNNR